MFPFASLLSLVLLVPHLVAAGPCDIYASGGTPCVAAHSTTRALYSAYSGALYQIIRGSDSATTDIHPLSAGGVANAAAQDSFCSGTTCLISIIYDQSANANHLTHSPAGTAGTGTDPGGFNNQAAADGAPVTLNGQKAYGVFVPPGTGYRNNNAVGTALGDAAEGMYAIFDGTHYNNDCCFDYGNAEKNNNDPGNGHMEALYFGLGTGFGTGGGSGPWLLADLENGLFTGPNTAVNPNNPTITDRFITGVLKGEPGNNWALRGGNSNSGVLTTYYGGARPTPGYNPMSKEGSIILGTGGDNSIRGQGTFYEGAMVSGYPFDATENAVQQNIQQAGYAVTSLVSGPVINVGSSVSLRATTACCTDRYIAHTGRTVNTQVVNSGSTNALKLSASWNVVTGLGNSGCISFESRDTPGSYIRHSGFELFVDANDGSAIFASDATYCPKAGLNGQGNSLRSFSYPAHYFRHFNALLYAASNGGPSDFDATASFNDDVSFVVSAAFA
ncbi:glycoside hydrolase family 54 protein [Roridomyces roridus]|uniref:Alpha-L-arabinofuranosidase n=1 Tax=Roridomyces roridus TaxID=1738132 RepID=A0AAD7FSI6_9AGAR|nr:glycoside hydrolase family 54 protein [Roridomyces roridus]